MKKIVLSLFCVFSFTFIFAQNQTPVNGKFELIPLPYASNALAPHIGKQTMETHHGKHVQTYINNLNDLIKNTKFEGLSLEDVIKKSKGSIYNNAAQVWNHNLFFSILSPKPEEAPSGNLEDAIMKDFGSTEEFKNAFNKEAKALFGSGWVWLIKKNNGSLEIMQTPNGNCPIDKGTPIIGLDVWEHAYYLDYQNKRADYIDAFWKVLDWQAVERIYDR